jgi:hypothetical protein
MAAPSIPDWISPPYAGLNVMDYGAVADGATDDTAHIQAALDAAALTTHKRVYIPSASYFLGPVSGETWALVPPAGVTLQGVGATSILVSECQFPISCEYSGIGLSRFKLVGDFTNTTQRGISLWGTLTGITLDNLTIQDCGFSGIHSDGNLTDVMVRSVNVSHCGDFGLMFQAEAGYGVDGLMVRDSLFTDFPGTNLYGSHGVYIRTAHDVTIIDTESSYAAGAGGQPSGFEIDDVDTGLLDGCYGHHTKNGIQISEYPSVGCRNIVIRNSGGSDNTMYDRYEYGTNENIVWEADCYGTLGAYP